ncbi:MAG: hypothetical protein N0C84_02040 [Candidatus Thiodiazotropha taylori]|uniref:Uncharacterized protein n=1 Tax=Candidatus Thiodiazotropha taylori TaxID=2792791 RepID=A0A9E4K9Z9_9GAMM|nr:hypothetical protein [Candidatus Thiodiazotropha taylori]MCW4255228.1 hypothetical protein [Candidatus Thiodiazotropha taylori]
MVSKLGVSILIGIGAGIIDITPGVMSGVDIRVTVAGFSFWVTTALVIAYISLPMQHWQKGLIIALLLAIPGVVLLSLVHPDSVIPMIVLTVILGALVGFLTGKYAN